MRLRARTRSGYGSQNRPSGLVPLAYLRGVAPAGHVHYCRVERGVLDDGPRRVRGGCAWCMRIRHPGRQNRAPQCSVGGVFGDRIGTTRRTKMSSSGSVYPWCGCRERGTGRRLGARCPRRGGEGHGSWYLSLELPPGPDARRRRIRRGGFSARADAQRALARLQMPVAGDHAPPVTVGQWLQLWLASRDGPRPSTLRGYAAHVRLYLVPISGRSCWLTCRRRTCRRCSPQLPASMRQPERRLPRPRLHGSRPPCGRR